MRRSKGSWRGKVNWVDLFWTMEDTLACTLSVEVVCIWMSKSISRNKWRQVKLSCIWFGDARLRVWINYYLSKTCSVTRFWTVWVALNLPIIIKRTWLDWCVPSVFPECPRSVKTNWLNRVPHKWRKYEPRSRLSRSAFHCSAVMYPKIMTIAS